MKKAYIFLILFMVSSPAFPGQGSSVGRDKVSLLGQGSSVGIAPMGLEYILEYFSDNSAVAESDIGDQNIDCNLSCVIDSDSFEYFKFTFEFGDAIDWESSTFKISSCNIVMAYSAAEERDKAYLFIDSVFDYNSDQKVMNCKLWKKDASSKLMIELGALEALIDFSFQEIMFSVE